MGSVRGSVPLDAVNARRSSGCSNIVNVRSALGLGTRPLTLSVLAKSKEMTSAVGAGKSAMYSFPRERSTPSCQVRLLTPWTLMRKASVQPRAASGPSQRTFDRAAERKPGWLPEGPKRLARSAMSLMPSCIVTGRVPSGFAFGWVLSTFSLIEATAWDVPTISW